MILLILSLISTIAAKNIKYNHITSNHFENLTQIFDTNQDGYLDKEEFAAFNDEILYNTMMFPKNIQYDKDEIFYNIWLNGSEVQSRKPEQAKKVSSEKLKAWYQRMENALNPKRRKYHTAFLVVEVQNDFITGSLALKNAPANQDGVEVVPIINNVLDDHDFPLTVYTMDWHPADHISFFSNLNKWSRKEDKNKTDGSDWKLFDTKEFSDPEPRNQTLWPDHCVQNSSGANLEQNLKIVRNAKYLRQGTKPNFDSYSAFFDNAFGFSGDTGLRAMLESRGIQQVFLAGLATDIVVLFTALDARKLGFETFVIWDGCRGIRNEGIEQSRKDLLKSGVMILNSDDLAQYTQYLTGELVHFPETKPRRNKNFNETEFINNIE